VRTSDFVPRHYKPTVEDFEEDKVGNGKGESSYGLHEGENNNCYSRTFTVVCGGFNYVSGVTSVRERRLRITVLWNTLFSYII
jgi:hypothetical protein